jgi:hypothetical protein
MGEIVRLLRWRGEWDGADLISGAEKAAAAGERLKKSFDEIGDKAPAALKKTGAGAKEAGDALEGLGLEAKQVEMYLGRLEKGSGSPLVLQRNAELAEAALNVLAFKAGEAGQALDEAFSGRVLEAIDAAKQQAAGMNAELEKMGGQTPTKLDKVITALEKTEASSSDVWAALRKMGDEGARAAVALERMQTAPLEQAARAAGIAELEMRDLRAAIDAARASGVQIGPDVGVAMNLAGQSIASTTRRAGEMREVMGDLKARSDLATKGFEATAGAAGSLEGLLSQLTATGGETSKAIAETGFRVIALGAAFKLGYTEGEKARQVLVDLGVPLPDLSNRISEAYVNLEKFARGAGEMPTRMSAMSGSIVDVAMKLGLLAAGYGQLEQPESAAITRARELLALRDQQVASEAKLQAYYAQAGVAWKDGYQELEKLHIALAAGEDRLKKAAANEQAYRLELEANGKVYADLIARSEELGISIEKEAGRVKAAGETWSASEEAKKKATEEFASKAIESLAKVEAAQKKASAAAAAATISASARYDEQMRALNALTVSEEEYSSRKKAIYDEMMAATTAAMASEAAAAETTKRAQKEVQETLDTTPEKFAEVEAAASKYNAEIEKGATPAGAMKTVIEELAIGMFSAAEAMGKAGEAAGTIKLGDMAVEVKSAAQAAAEAGTNLGAMASGLDSIVGSGGRTIDLLNRLAGAFRAVGDAAAAAGGGGGPVISNAGPGAPVELAP